MFRAALKSENMTHTKSDQNSRDPWLHRERDADPRDVEMDLLKLLLS